MVEDPVAAEVDRLRARLAKLDEQVEKIDDERGQIKFALSVLARVSASVPTEHRVVSGRAKARVSASAVTNRTPDGSYDYALRALRALNRPERMEAILEKMLELGWVTNSKNPLETARVAVSRVVADGLAHRPAYGMYALAPGASSIEDDANNVEPAAPVSDQIDSKRAFSWEEQELSDAQTV